MAVICPTILAETEEDFAKQVAAASKYAKRIHIDLADGVFAPTKLVDITKIGWPAGVKADLHVMYQTVKPFLDTIISLRPNLVIVHAESVGNFHDVAPKLKEVGIKVGVALLADTPVNKIAPAIKDIDHVLIFSGDLGHYGGVANMSLLQKAAELRRLKNDLEIGWDGGINLNNAKQLKVGGIDVLNVGGAIHGAANPANAYAKLEAVIK